MKQAKTDKRNFTYRIEPKDGDPFNITLPEGRDNWALGELTFAHSAVDSLRGSGRRLVVYSLYDFDRSGKDVENSLVEKVNRFGAEYGVETDFHSLGLSYDQVTDWGLPTRPPKRKTPADQRWPYDFAAELDAIPPDDLRALVSDAIEEHLPSGELAKLKHIEGLERQTLQKFLGRVAQ